MLAIALPVHSDCVQSASHKGRDMNIRFILMLALSALSVPAVSAMAPKQDQQVARKQMNDGKVLSLRQIEARVLPQMRGMEYLGPEYFEDSRVYRLKFVDNGRVIFVDVDARSGSIIRQR
jgi:hypothetical protein